MLKEGFTIKKLLYTDKNGSKVYLCHNEHIELTIAGRGISKSINKWVEDDTSYTNRLLVKEINRLRHVLEALENN